MVKIDSREVFKKMDPRKLDKIQIYPSKQHCGYNKMSNQLPKLTKTIMSPLTTMPPRKPMLAPNNGAVAIKPSPPPPPTRVDAPLTAMQFSAMKNNFAAKHNPVPVNSPKMPTFNIVSKSEPKSVDKVREAAAGYRSEQISLNDLHPYITCFLCRGYLIEATTIVECLHTYCHSCLMKHLAKEKCCPQCDMSINKSKTNIK